MKPKYHAAMILAIAMPFSAQGGELAGAGKASLRPTHDQLAKHRAAGPEITKGAAHFTPVDPSEIQKRNPEARSLLERSAILSFGGFWTMVPKDAVIHIPANLRSRVVSRPKGRLLGWKEFLVRNRGWIHTQSVTLSDARGDTRLPEEIIDAYRRTGRVVVAVCHNGPISLKKSPRTEEAESASNS